MNIKITQNGEAVPAANDFDLLLTDIRAYGGFYVVKNSFGAKNFLLPTDYLGLFITQPNLVPAFSLVMPQNAPSNPPQSADSQPVAARPPI